MGKVTFWKPVIVIKILRLLIAVKKSKMMTTLRVYFSATICDPQANKPWSAYKG